MQGPFPVDLVIARAEQVEGVKIVGIAADLDAAMQTPPRNTPAIYVLSEEQGARPLGSTGKLIQDIATTIKFVMWVRHAGGAKQTSAAMIALERAARRAFFGWRPDDEATPIHIRASGMDQGHGDYLIRQLLLTSSYRQTTEATSTP